MSGHQQTIYTIHESQLNNNGGGSGNSASSAAAAAAVSNGNGNGQGNGQRNGQSNSDILIDTSSIPLTQQQTMPPMHHQHIQAQQQQQYNETITSQPIGASTSGSGTGGTTATASSSSARVAPESQNVVYSVHPIFNMLDNHDTLLIRQKADCTSTCCGFESTNTYTVRSRDGSPILKAIENSNCCERCCFEANREYNLSLVYGDEIVARIRKPYRVSRFCCYTNAVRIESPEDNPIGQIKQMFTLFGHPRYAIYDCQQSPKTPSFYIESISCRFCCTPCLCVCLCGNEQFRIISIETKEEVGTISRHWQSDSTADNDEQSNAAAANNNNTNASGANGDEMANAVISSNNNNNTNQQSTADEPFNTTLLANNNTRESAFGGGAVLSSSTSGAFGEADQLFGIQMAPNLEARQKVLLLSACFMMDFFYFENDRRRRKLASC